MKLQETIQTYLKRLRAFRPNARLYLVSVLLTGAATGVFRLLFNFYVLSLGYDEAILGRLISTMQFSALLLAFPMGYLVDIFGRKQALVARSILLSFAIGMMALIPTILNFYIMNAILGVSMALSTVAMAPFLMENSGEEERTYLFSWSSGLRMGSVFIGNWVGGFLPTWMGDLQAVAATDSRAYGGALLVMAIIGLVGFIPLVRIKPVYAAKTRRKDFAPFTFAKDNPGLLFRLLFPSLLISIGAGLFMPFMNVFFRVVHLQPDPVIGTILAWGALAMAIGLVVAPPLAGRLGKIRLVTLTQGLSIPFMALLGFVPVFGIAVTAYYFRIVFMNMANPIYQTFVMEQVDASSRATIASLVSMVFSFGRAFSPTISGYLQVEYGFGPPFAIAIGLYSTAVFLYWLFFVRQGRGVSSVPVPGD